MKRRSNLSLSVAATRSGNAVHIARPTRAMNSAARNSWWESCWAAVTGARLNRDWVSDARTCNTPGRCRAWIARANSYSEFHDILRPWAPSRSFVSVHWLRSNYLCGGAPLPPPPFLGREFERRSFACKINIYSGKINKWSFHSFSSRRVALAIL